jgi:hypothetical protein
MGGPRTISPAPGIIVLPVPGWQDNTNVSIGLDEQYLTDLLRDKFGVTMKPGYVKSDD